MTEPNTEQKGFTLGFHGIPDHGKLAKMSFAELASELATATKDSPKYLVVEREMKSVIASDQARINRVNVYIGGFMAGVFGLSGVVLGWWLRDTSAMQQPTQSSAVHQVQQSQVKVQPNLSNIPPLQTPASNPIAVPGPVKANAQAGNPVR